MSKVPEYIRGDAVAPSAQALTGIPNILASGNLGINTPATSYTLQVSGTIGVTGDITGLYSDDRLKERVGVIEGALAKVEQLSAFIYVNNDTAKSFGFNDDERRVGLSAQDVQRILPEVVKPAPFDADNNSGSKYLTVQYDRLVPLLVEAIKELSLEVKKLKEK